MLKEDKKRRFIFWWWWLPILFIFISGIIYFTVKTTNKKTNTNKADIIKIGDKKPAIPFNTIQQKLDLTKQNNNNTIAKDTAKNQAVSTFDDTKEINVATNKTNLDNKRSIGYLTVTKGKPNNNQPFKEEKHGFNDDLNPTGFINYNSNKYLNKTIEQPFISVDTNGDGNDANNLNKIKNNNGVYTNPVLAFKNGKPQNAKNDNIKNDTDKNQLDTVLNKLKETAIIKTNTDSAQKTAIIKPLDSTLNTQKKINKTRPTKLSKFDFSTLAEADLSMVKFKKVEKLSNGFGIGISYKLAKRWSVGTGISYSTKLYVADSTDYQKAVFNAWGLTVLNIEANCKVIEIPIYVQYLIAQKKKSRWYATAGLSSYFMKSEDYDYTIIKNGMIKNMDYYYKNENKHIMSILTLQADYNKKINNQFSWQLSPFIKLPLTGIGEGHVSLESLGLQFSLHFKPKKKQ